MSDNLQSQQEQEFAARLMRFTVGDSQEASQELQIHPASSDPDPDGNTDPDAEAAKGQILALYDQGKPFYTKEIIKDIETKVAALDLSEPDLTITHKGVAGRDITRPVTLTDAYNPTMAASLTVYHYENMIDHVDHKWSNELVRLLAMSPIDIFVDEESPLHDVMPKAHWEEHFSVVTAHWLESDECAKVISILEKCGDNINKVNKIICFGLGDFSRDKNPEFGPRCAAQYAAAHTIATFINEKLTGESLEPNADPVTVEILKNSGITTYLGSGRAFHGYVDLDDNTLVVSLFPEAPVRSVIADIARPVIMVCNGHVKGGKENEKLYWQGRGYKNIPRTLDPVTPRLLAMLENDYTDTPIVKEMMEDQPESPLNRVFVYVRKVKDEAAETKDDGAEGKDDGAEVEQAEGSSQDAEDKTQV